MTRWLRDQWVIVWVGTRWPYRRKYARTSVVMWSIALATAVLSAIAEIITAQWPLLLFVSALGAFDFVMLHRAVLGLLWRRNLDKTLSGTRFMS